MKLTAEEYTRGILYWNTATGMRVRTSDTLVGDPPRWSNWLTEPSGSRVQSPGHSNLRFDVQVGNPEAVTEQQFLLRLERSEMGAIATQIMGGPMAASYSLHNVPNYGIFHRLVLAVDNLRWDEDMVIRHGDIVVRLINGKIAGEALVTIEHEELQEHTMVVTGSPLETIEREGRFIEIVAPGETESAAEQLCHTVLGYIAVCLGENAIAEVVFSQGTQASPQVQFWKAQLPPFAARYLQRVEDEQTGALDQKFPLLLHPGNEPTEMQNAYQVTLRLYERGVRDRDPLDSYVSFFFGIEALLNAYADKHGPIPEKQHKKDRLNKLLQSLPQPVARETRSWLRDQLHRTTLTENLAFFVSRHGWEAGLLTQFQDMKKLRDNISHGRLPMVELWQAEQAKALLIRILKAEFGLSAITPPTTISESSLSARDLGIPPEDGDAAISDEVSEEDSAE